MTSSRPVRSNVCEKSPPFSRRRNRIQNLVRARLPGTFIVEEEKCPILAVVELGDPDRPPIFAPKTLRWKSAFGMPLRLFFQLLAFRWLLRRYSHAVA